jgi:hypothetical protein
MFRDPGGHPDRGDEAARVRYPTPGDVQRRTVVRGRAHEWQADGNVDPLRRRPASSAESRPGRDTCRLPRRKFGGARGVNIVSGGYGPETSIPSRFRISIAGAIVSISWRPILPPSLACGLSPAIARRGFRIPKPRLNPEAAACATSTIFRVDSPLTAAASASCIETGTIFSSSLASIIVARQPVFLEKFRVSWKRKTAFVQNGLLDRVRHESARLACCSQFDRAADSVNHRCSVAGIRLPHPDRRREMDGHDGQSSPERIARLSRVEMTFTGTCKDSVCASSEA